MGADRLAMLCMSVLLAASPADAWWFGRDCDCWCGHSAACQEKKAADAAAQASATAKQPDVRDVLLPESFLAELENFKQILESSDEESDGPQPTRSGCCKRFIAKRPIATTAAALLTAGYVVTKAGMFESAVPKYPYRAESGLR